jgi:hypothetical protein
VSCTSRPIARYGHPECESRFRPVAIRRRSSQGCRRCHPGRASPSGRTPPITVFVAPQHRRNHEVIDTRDIDLHLGPDVGKGGHPGREEDLRPQTAQQRTKAPRGLGRAPGQARHRPHPCPRRPCGIDRGTTAGSRTRPGLPRRPPVRIDDAADRLSNRPRGLFTQIHPHLERVIGSRMQHPAVLRMLDRFGSPALIRKAGRRPPVTLIRPKAPPHGRASDRRRLHRTGRADRPTRNSGSSIRGEQPSRQGNKQLKRVFPLSVFAALSDPTPRTYYAEDRPGQAPRPCSPPPHLTPSRHALRDAPRRHLHQPPTP